MKKMIMAALMFASFALLVSCGGSTKEDKKDEEKKDTVKVVEDKPVVKDFKYYDKLASELKLEGMELTSSNTYSDSSSKAFNRGFSIKNSKEIGADKIMINAGSVARLGNKDDVVCSSLADFEKAQTKLNQSRSGVSCSDFKEWKKGEDVFYYFTLKGVSDQMGGKKNYNQLFARYVNDDVYLDVIVNVYDNTADLAKAEEILKKAMEYVVK